MITLEILTIGAYFAGVGFTASVPIKMWRRNDQLDALFAIQPRVAGLWIAVAAVGWPGIPLGIGLNRLASRPKRGAR
ncbi:hypothetical protein ACWEQC_21795 [Streptomyces shenzhenensis]